MKHRRQTLILLDQNNVVSEPNPCLLAFVGRLHRKCVCMVFLFLHNIRVFSLRDF